MAAAAGLKHQRSAGSRRRPLRLHVRSRSRLRALSFESDLFSPPDRTVISATATQDGSGVSLGANLGVQWTVAGLVKLGASYRYGPIIYLHAKRSDPGASSSS